MKEVILSVELSLNVVCMGRRGTRGFVIPLIELS